MLPVELIRTGFLLVYILMFLPSSEAIYSECRVICRIYFLTLEMAIFVHFKVFLSQSEFSDNYCKYVMNDRLICAKCRYWLEFSF